MSKEGLVKRFNLLFTYEVFAKNIISVLQVSLIFYFTKNLALDSKHAFKWLASFGMIAYASPLFAGYVTDKILGPTKAMTLGLFIMLTGSFLALHENTYYTLVGIVLIGSGSGFFKPNILTLLDSIFKTHDEKRALYFGRFYLASSVGEIFAVIMGGILAEYFLVYNPFYLSTFSVLTALSLYLSNRKKMFETSIKRKITPSKFLFITLFSLMILFLSILYDLNEIILAMALIALILVIRGYNNEEIKENKRSALKLFIMILYGALFFSLTVQCYFSLNLAIENFVERNISDKFSIPTFWFLLINPIVSLLVGNYVSEYYKKYNLIKRMVYGFFVLSFGYFILFISFYICEDKINLGVILFSYTVFVIASFIIIPQLISELTYSVSKKYKARGVGVWYLTMALAQYLAGYIANFIHSDLTTSTPRNLSIPLLYIFLFSIIFSTILKINNKKLSLIILEK